MGKLPKSWRNAKLFRIKANYDNFQEVREIYGDLKTNYFARQVD